MTEAATVTADALDQLRIEQLHAAALKASDSCFEIKKMCATLVVATGTLVSVFTDKALSTGVFAAGSAVVIAFWLADAVGFFYQRKLRALMDGLILDRARRCPDGYTFKPAAAVGPIRAAFNSSMIFYLLLIVLIGAGWVLWGIGAIDSTPSTT